LALQFSWQVGLLKGV